MFTFTIILNIFILLIHVHSGLNAQRYFLTHFQKPPVFKRYGFTR